MILPEPRTDEGVWVFIVADMGLFSVFFNVYAYYRVRETELFTTSQATLERGFGLANTIVLLSSSLFVVRALQAVRRQDRRSTRHWLLASLTCGVVFCALKLIEYARKLAAGIDLTSNDFYMYYFMFTGLHALHLLLGMGVLIYLMALARRTQWQSNDLRAFAGGAAYWHMVDLLWIVLFTLLYLIN
jgi:nitric oxide reductase NorE protein